MDDSETTISSFIDKVQAEILAPIVTLLALAAFVLFAWGIVQFIAGATDEEKRRTGQRHMIWAVVGLAILFGANAIVSLLENLVGRS